MPLSTAGQLWQGDIGTVFRPEPSPGMLHYQTHMNTVWSCSFWQKHDVRKYRLFCLHNRSMQGDKKTWHTLLTCSLIMCESPWEDNTMPDKDRGRHEKCKCNTEQDVKWFPLGKQQFGSRAFLCHVRWGSNLKKIKSCLNKVNSIFNTCKLWKQSQHFS